LLQLQFEEKNAIALFEDVASGGDRSTKKQKKKRKMRADHAIVVAMT
jgi:hypothetical protein